MACRDSEVGSSRTDPKHYFFFNLYPVRRPCACKDNSTALCPFITASVQINIKWDSCSGEISPLGILPFFYSTNSFIFGICELHRLIRFILFLFLALHSSCSSWEKLIPLCITRLIMDMCQVQIQHMLFPGDNSSVIRPCCLIPTLINTSCRIGFFFPFFFNLSDVSARSSRFCWLKRIMAVSALLRWCWRLNVT